MGKAAYSWPAMPQSRGRAGNEYRHSGRLESCLEVGSCNARCGRAELLGSYDAERRPVAHKVLKETHLLTRMVTLRNPAAEYVRNKVAPVLIHAAESAIAENMSQLAVSYRGSPVSEDHHVAGSLLRAGDRSPVVFPFETFTLLVTGAAAIPESIGRYAGFVTVRKEQNLVAFPSTEPALFLVWPDQYIAFRGPAAHAGPALAGYLERLLPHVRL